MEHESGALIPLARLVLGKSLPTNQRLFLSAHNTSRSRQRRFPAAPVDRSQAAARACRRGHLFVQKSGRHVRVRSCLRPPHFPGIHRCDSQPLQRPHLCRAFHSAPLLSPIVSVSPGAAGRTAIAPAGNPHFRQSGQETTHCASRGAQRGSPGASPVPVTSPNGP